MHSRARRNALGRLTMALLIVATLAGFGPSFPTDVGTSSGWRFLLTHVYSVLHAGIGVLALAEAVRLMVTSLRNAPVLPAIGVGGLVLSIGSGVWYVSHGQPETALTTMTIGWLIAQVAYTVGFVRAWRGARSASRATTIPHR